MDPTCMCLPGARSMRKVGCAPSNRVYRKKRYSSKPSMSRIMFQGRSGLAAFFLCLCGIAVAAQPREMTSEDIAAWREIQDGRLSADGAWLAYLLAPDAGSTQREATV